MTDRCRDDGADGLDNARMLAALDAEGHGEIGAPDEQQIDAVDRRDRVETLERRGILDLAPERAPGIRTRGMAGRVAQAEAARSRGWREAAAAADVEGFGNGCRGDRLVDDMRDHDAGDAEIEHPSAQARFERGQAHETRDRRGAPSQCEAIDRLDTERRMLGVDDREIEAGTPAYFDRIGRPELQEGAGERRVGLHAGAKVRIHGDLPSTGLTKSRVSAMSTSEMTFRSEEQLDTFSQRLESVDLVLAMLELLAEAPEQQSLGDIARKLDISKSRAHRHLRALGVNGYVHQDSDDRYGVGARLVKLADVARSRLTFAVAAREAMAVLRDRTRETVTASALVGGKVTIVELLNGSMIVQFAVRPGTVMSPTRSAHGLVAAAFGGLDIADAPPPAEPLVDIRARGWAVAPGMMMTGVNALAAPVFDHAGVWAGTIALVGSIDTIPAEPETDLVMQVTDAARQASQRLGWRQTA